jgi:shikimate dehydrogenase
VSARAAVPGAVTAVTRVVAVIGRPVRHSLSPLMHNAAFAALGLDYRYVAFDVAPAAVGAAVAGMRAFGIAGLNVTIPHKQAVMRHLDQLTPEAEQIGAVNTIEVRGRRLIGHNTDSRGFAEALRRGWGLRLAGRRVVLLGAGGAARAVAVQCLLERATAVVIVNRSPGPARALLRRLRALPGRTQLASAALTPHALARLLPEHDLIINATSLGLHPGDPSPVPPDLLRSGHHVCDLIYNPPETALLRAAAAAGAATLNGVGMLVAQGALAFTLWTGRRAPVKVMESALFQALMRRRRARPGF